MMDATCQIQVANQYVTWFLLLRFMSFNDVNALYIGEAGNSSLISAKTCGSLRDNNHNRTRTYHAKRLSLKELF